MSIAAPGEEFHCSQAEPNMNTELKFVAPSQSSVYIHSEKAGQVKRDGLVFFDIASENSYFYRKVSFSSGSVNESTVEEFAIVMHD